MLEHTKEFYNKWYYTLCLNCTHSNAYTDMYVYVGHILDMPVLHCMWVASQSG